MNTHSILTAANGAFGRIRDITRITSRHPNTRKPSISSGTAAPQGIISPPSTNNDVTARYGRNNNNAGTTPKYEYQCSLIERVIPIHWAYAIGKQTAAGGHIIRIRRVTQRIRHIQINHA